MTIHHKDLCPCGSGKRYKHCHLPIRQAQQRRLILSIVGVAVLAAGAAFAWTVMSGRAKSSAGSAASDAARPAGGATSAQLPGSTTGGDAGSAFGTLQPGVNGRSPTPAQQGDKYTVPTGNELAPGEVPAPWEYDVANNRHYDPRPGHGHWHPGPPPKDPNAPQAQVLNPNITATTGSGTQVNISGTSSAQTQTAPSTPLAPGENPKPYEYDAKRDLYFDPGHQHWHPGKPPVTAGATGGTTTR